MRLLDTTTTAGLHTETGFWSLSPPALLQQLETTPHGLSHANALQRLQRYGHNLLTPKRRTNTLTLLGSQFTSPILLLLFFAAGLSFFLHDSADTAIILGIVLVSGLLGFWQERGAIDAVEKLLAVVNLMETQDLGEILDLARRVLPSLFKTG